MLSVGSVTRALLCGLSLLLTVHSGVGADTQAISCEDGSHATLEHAAVHMGRETKRWSCVMKSTENNAESMDKMNQVKDFDLCPASCKTYCEKAIENGGPDPEDCKALSSYYAGGGRFTIDPKKYIIWEYNTCRVTQYNRLGHAEQKISYCFDHHHWAGVVNHLSRDCGAKSGSRGGSCYFYDSLHFSTITLEKA